MARPASEKSIMLVEATNRTLRYARSSGVYANLAGHRVDYIAFITYQGTYVAQVEYVKKRVPLNEIYPDVESKVRTNLYRVKNLTKSSFRRDSKIPRGRKRVANYGKFLESFSTSELFKAHR